jgi:predicted GH43/DUF377 family glycosyl hydrolase
MSRSGLTLAVLLALPFTQSCGRYADFALPTAGGQGTPVPVTWQWTESSEPQLQPGQPGSWDSIDVLNPSIIRRDVVYWNYYSGFDGRAWHTGLATSPDGVAWSKQGKVLSPDAGSWEGAYIAANGSALVHNNETLYWYQAGPKGATRIGLARSRDGRTFRREPGPVLELGPYASWDEVALGDPFVMHEAGVFWMFYLGQDRARRQRLGLARSGDGVRWTKLRSNPILEQGESGSFDENGLGEPAVWPWGGEWWMIYTGRDRKERRRLGLAHSSDGVHWMRVPDVFTGAQAWNSMVICDPTVLTDTDGVRVWFGGGDIASPDENLHGRIGFAILKPR